jgi:hypothetical protein
LREGLMAESTRVLNGLRLLVVEDNFLIAETLRCSSRIGEAS